MNIPFLNFEPIHSSIRDEMKQAYERVYDSYWYVLGENVSQFEVAYASFSETAHCIGVSNGLDALHLSLKACGIGRGDEVIVPSNTYIATALAVSFVGATPIFVEPNQHTYNLDPANIARSITPKTKAIIPVHLFGQACEMETIMNLAKKHNLFVIEDNAQAQGASFINKRTGSWGHCNATSFYPGKNLGALGDAGAVTTNSVKFAKKIKVFRNYGSQKKYFNEVLGHNMRLDELQAAFLKIKLNYLGKWTKERQQIAGWYNDALKSTNGIILPIEHAKATHVYHLYVIRTERRDELQNYLTSKGIGTLIHYPIPPHLQEAYNHLGHKKGEFPIAEELAKTSLSLPIWPGMEEKQVHYISEKINFFFNEY